MSWKIIPKKVIPEKQEFICKHCGEEEFRIKKENGEIIL